MNDKSKLSEPKIIELPKFLDARGNLSFFENRTHIPFDIKRTYWIYDVPGGEERGGHAHKELQQLIVAASGSFDVILDDGNIKRTISLNRPYYGLLVVPGIWRELNNFSSGSVCLVLASEVYKQEDYIRSYDEFLEWKNGKSEVL